MDKVQVARSNSANVRELLRRHPRVVAVEVGEDVLSFDRGDWPRQVRVGDLRPLRGLIELADNNPLVCADFCSVPSAAATLASIALGPLAAAGMLTDSPTFICNADIPTDEVELLLKDLGWDGGVVCHTEPADTGGVIAATAMASIRTPDDLQEIDDLYEERFGRSFFVHRNEVDTWDPALVLGTPNAVYRLRIGVDQPDSLLTIRVMADPEGKAGAGQVVHAMNVMSGFEESLGLV